MSAQAAHDLDTAALTAPDGGLAASLFAVARRQPRRTVLRDAGDRAAWNGRPAITWTYEAAAEIVGRLARGIVAWRLPAGSCIGLGFAGIPFANDGVLFGLEALRGGLITTEQFVDLNEQVGGLDVDNRRTDDRTRGDLASVANAYRTGLVNEANHLDEVAILNHGGPTPASPTTTRTPSGPRTG